MDNVEKGMTLYIDGWKAYKQLDTLGYLWESVNHSEHFLSPTNPSCHSNKIEGTWRCSLEDYLPMYLWFNQNRKIGTNNFWCLLNILSKNMEGESVIMVSRIKLTTTSLNSVVCPRLF